MPSRKFFLYNAFATGFYPMKGGEILGNVVRDDRRGECRMCACTSFTSGSMSGRGNPAGYR